MKTQSEAFYKSIEEVESYFGTNRTEGLKQEEIAGITQKYGPNSIQQKEAKSSLKIFLGQFNSPLVYLLLGAGILSFILGEFLDGFAIIIVIVINGLIGFFMEYQAERSMEALKRLTDLSVKVIRSSTMREIASSEIVPGDLLFLEAGDMIPADARLVSIHGFEIDESALTGESLPVEKKLQPIEKGTPLAERLNMVFKGTFVTKGNAYAIVTAIGMDTELGRIASMVQTARESSSPLEKKLSEFSKKLIAVTTGLVVIIFIGGLLNGQKFVEILETSIALAVAAIPEGLPIVATLALAHGMLGMARKNVLIKKLSAVETLGGTTIICTDKTGTLTENRIEVHTVAIPAITGILQIPPEHIDPKYTSTGLLAQIGTLCNTAQYSVSSNTPAEVGDPLEIGLLKFAVKCGLETELLRIAKPKVDEYPFNSETKLMSTVHKDEHGWFVAVKGSVESVLALCATICQEGVLKEFQNEAKAEWNNAMEELALKGLRVLAFAYSEKTSQPAPLENDLTFAGMIGFLDPPRSEVKSAIEECMSAGIKVVMITGDHPATAQTIAEQLGLNQTNNSVVMNGRDMSDLEALNANEREKWLHTAIFARVSPKQKLDLVSLLQKEGNVIAMTGDGINDAPALKKADVGVAMGKRGTQVAQEVADVILKDDSFSSIVLAVRQGRILYENVRHSIIFLLSCNLSELLVVATASLLNLHFQLIPIQILFINLITDVLPALALGVGKGDETVMERPPRSITEAIVTNFHWKQIVVYASMMSVVTLGAVWTSHELFHNSEVWNPVLCNNILFFTLIFCQLAHVLNMSNSRRIFKNDVLRNKYIWFSLLLSGLILSLVYNIPFLRKVLGISQMSVYDWGIVLSSAFVYLVISHILKLTGVLYHENNRK